MLRSGAHPRHHEHDQQSRDTPHSAQGEESKRRKGRSRRKNPRLSPSLGQESGRYLKEGEGAGMAGSEKSDFGKREKELPLKDGKENVQEAGEAVME
jgi:hypothetical protein